MKEVKIKKVQLKVRSKVDVEVNIGNVNTKVTNKQHTLSPSGQPPSIHLTTPAMVTRTGEKYRPETGPFFTAPTREHKYQTQQFF